MGGILRRKILTEDKNTSISVDRETPDAVKYWAKKESISMAQATKIMVITFTSSQALTELKTKGSDERTEALDRLIKTCRDAKRKVTDRELPES